MIKFWLKLLNLYLNRKNDYFAFQEFQAEKVVKYVKEKLKLSSNINVIDYGCGNGGYSAVLANHFDNVKAVDFYCNPPKNLKYRNIEFINANLVDYKIEPVEFIFCSSVIEHIPKDKQALFIENLNKNLKDNGYLYLSFPPFYSLQGGHWCYPFHYFPDKIAFFLTKLFKNRDIISYETMWGDWGLTKTSIKDIEKLLLENNFRIMEINSRFMPSWFSRLFAKIDFLNWHVEFIAKKEA